MPSMASWRVVNPDPSTPQGLGMRNTLDKGISVMDSGNTLDKGISVIDSDKSVLFVNDASTLSDLFRRQEIINSVIKYSLQELCGQLRADSQVQATPMRSVGRGRARSASGAGSQMPGAQRMMTIGRGGH